MSDPARSRTVLVVEDDAAIRELLHLHLDLAGFAIEEAEDGRKALDRARSTPFDLVLLDVMLPGLDGVSVCRAIRNAGPNVDTPILMLTAREGESDKVLGLESGADDYLTKPFGVRELTARIAALMRRLHRQVPAAPDCVAQPEQTEGPYFVDKVLERSDIRSDPATGRISAGAPLALQFVLSKVTSTGVFAVLPGAQVDIWHCDALGAYSDVRDRSRDTLGQQFLRGYQVSDREGRVRFITIYPAGIAAAQSTSISRYECQERLGVPTSSRRSCIFQMSSPIACMLRSPMLRIPDSVCSTRAT